jgi:hypothetical protein
MSDYDPEDSDTRALAEKPCPGCGFEPEVLQYWVDTVTKRRRGYTCTCGFRVIDGIVVMTGDRF